MIEEKSPSLVPAWLNLNSNQPTQNEKKSVSSDKRNSGRNPFNRSQTYHMFRPNHINQYHHQHPHQNQHHHPHSLSSVERTNWPKASTPTSGISPTSSTNKPLSKEFPRPLNRSYSADQGKLEKLNSSRQSQPNFEEDFPTLSSSTITPPSNTSQSLEGIDKGNIKNPELNQENKINQDGKSKIEGLVGQNENVSNLSMSNHNNNSQIPLRLSKESVWNTRKHSQPLIDIGYNVPVTQGTIGSGGELSKQERAKLVPNKPTYHLTNKPLFNGKRRETGSSNSISNVHNHNHPHNPIVHNGHTIISPPLSPHKLNTVNSSIRHMDNKNPKLDDIRKNFRKMTSAPSLPIHGPAGEAARMVEPPDSHQSPLAHSPVKNAISPRSSIPTPVSASTSASTPPNLNTNTSNVSSSEVMIVERPPEQITAAIGNRLEFLQTIRNQDYTKSSDNKKVDSQNYQNSFTKDKCQHDCVFESEFSNTEIGENRDERGILESFSEEEEERFLKELGWEGKNGIPHEEIIIEISDEERRQLQEERKKIQKLREEKKSRLEEQMRIWTQTRIISSNQTPLSS